MYKTEGLYIPDGAGSFDHWEVNGKEAEIEMIEINGEPRPYLKDPITEELNIVAVFRLNEIKASVSSSANDRGSASVAEELPYLYGEQITLTATLADEHYRFTGWSDGSVDNPRVVTIGTYDHKMGTTTVDSRSYKYLTYAHLEAKPQEGYYFIGWDNGITFDVYDLLVESDTTVTPLFAERPLEQFTITLQASPAEGGQVHGAGTYDRGSEIHILAEAAEGYEFVQWSDGVQDNPRKVVVTEDKTYTAEFKQKEAPKKEYTITVYVTPDESGRVEGTGTYKEGETAVLVALPATGYEFSHWSDNSTDNPREIVVEKNLTLICNFHKIGDGVENIETGVKTEESEPRKELRQGHIVIIMPDGSEYDAQGRQIK